MIRLYVLLDNKATTFVSFLLINYYYYLVFVLVYMGAIPSFSSSFRSLTQDLVSRSNAACNHNIPIHEGTATIKVVRTFVS